MSERNEGWGSLVNAQKAHYFSTSGRSLCGRWACFGTPVWESNQKRGAKADSGTCAACWKKAPDVAPMPQHIHESDGNCDCYYNKKKPDHG